MDKPNDNNLAFLFSH